MNPHKPGCSWLSGRPCDCPRSDGPIARKDFTLGQRGGDWYAFHNTPAARDAIKSKAIALSYGADLEAAKKAVEARFFTWEVEP